MKMGITHQVNTTTNGAFIDIFLRSAGESLDKRTPNPPPEAEHRKQYRQGRAARAIGADAVEIGKGDPF